MYILRGEPYIRDFKLEREVGKLQWQRERLQLCSDWGYRHDVGGELTGVTAPELAGEVEYRELAVSEQSWLCWAGGFRGYGLVSWAGSRRGGGLYVLQRLYCYMWLSVCFQISICTFRSHPPTPHVSITVLLARNWPIQGRETPRSYCLGYPFVSLVNCMLKYFWRFCCWIILVILGQESNNTEECKLLG